MLPSRYPATGQPSPFAPHPTAPSSGFYYPGASATGPLLPPSSPPPPPSPSPPRYSSSSSSSSSSPSPSSAKTLPRISLPLHYDIVQPAVPRRKLLRLAVLASFLSLLFLATFISLGSSLPGPAASPTDRLSLLITFPHAVESENSPPDFANLADLVVVAGHAIYVGNDYAAANLTDERKWVLEDYQRGNGQVETFLEHIRKGVEIADQNPQALLMFAGGPTRRKAGMRSEGQSYWLLAHAMFPDSPVLTDRAFTEDRSRDSHENLLFSIARFCEVTGRYPQSITVVGFEFKRNRFTDIHRMAVRWPKSRFTYIGIDPPGLSHPALASGEDTNSLNPFRKDVYGCHGELREKKLRRNPFRHSSLGYVLTAGEISGLLSYCPKDGVSLYPGRLPWSSSIDGL